MVVQASQDQISTFHAYAAMGLKKDYRNYEDVMHAATLLGLKNAKFILLTNNPDKINAMKAQGLKVVRAEPLEFEPSPFNLAYLASKAVSGHVLDRPGKTDVKSMQPPEPVEPFAPHAIPDAQRFVYTASYFLPVKPVDSEILLTEAQFREHKVDIERQMLGPSPLVKDCYLIRDNRFIVEIDYERFLRFRKERPLDPLVPLFTTPYWFKVHVYYDIVTSQEFVVLTYGKAKIYDLPVIRLQSESLFNRFPLTNKDNRDKFKKSVREIVHYGVGAICLLYFDGRGAGFGAHATDRMLTERGVALSSDEAYRKLGVSYDSRDYDASFTLLKHHIPSGKVQMIMNSPSSLVKKTEYASALNRHKIEVEKWIFLDEHSLQD
jgi:3,4-dihydroxy 2-butanone 4-phosphate synthase/GTP cyclohydrolase II